MRRATNILMPGEGHDRKPAGHLRLDHHHRHRRRLVLKTEEGEAVLLDLPVAAIATETGVPVGTVKARLARGRRTLATLVDDDESEANHV